MMTQYLLPCSCGQKTRITAAQAGEQVACACGKTLSVPTLRGIKQLEIAPDASTRTDARSWTPIHGVIFAVGLAIAAVGLVLVAYYGLLYAQIDKRYTRDYTDAFVQAERARIEKLSLNETFDEWSKNVTEGLGEREPPPWLAVQKVVARYLSFVKGGAITILAGCLLAAVALLIPRR